MIIRLINKYDEKNLQDFIDGLSKRSHELWYPPSIEQIYKYTTLIAVLNKKIIGIVFYISHPDYEYPSISIAIADAYHRKGIGTQLMEALFSLALENDYKGLYVGVLKANQKAILFYRRLGFKLVGEKIARNGEPAWELKWQKE